MKMVKAYGGSPEWKPEYLIVKSLEKFCVAWNHQEVEGLGVIKDEWSKEDHDSVEKFADDLKKILKYSKLVKWSDVQYYVPLVLVEEGKDTNILVEEKKDEEESTTVAVGAKRKRKRLVKISDKEKTKKADVLSSKSTVQGENTMPPAMEKISAPLSTEKAATPQVEVYPSTKAPIVDKGKDPLEEEATIMPSRAFEGGPIVAVHTFGDPPTIECPLLEEFAASTSEVSMAYLMHLRNLKEELVQARIERDQALVEKAALEEKNQQIQAKEQELASVQGRYIELDEKLRAFADLHISREDLHK
ncbi:OLC1v1018838C1 [Oldenlandia corymbosa var. corymbosa]|uniref:OLC1v1018838C1 n=1 Tax=Oldenlandia corymbosa var. corymbosa TaxID=529605 RepID=A0AAV1ECI3_OLDCO|nr:OLC1v1018838C1 [Oldenlandia corymbosa var. corymbosa]